MEKLDRRGLARNIIIMGVMLVFSKFIKDLGIFGRQNPNLWALVANIVYFILAGVLINFLAVDNRASLGLSIVVYTVLIYLIPYSLKDQLHISILAIVLNYVGYLLYNFYRLIRRT